MSFTNIDHHQVRDAIGNEYGRAKDVAGESRIVFTSHADAAFDVCFENLFSGSTLSHPFFFFFLHHVSRVFTYTSSLLPDTKPRQNLRVVELDIDIGADAKDWSAIQATEKLKPVEAELRRIEELTGEVVREMEYLRSREQTLRDTNESTNNRVKWFGVGTTWLLVILWAWQIMYLRAYFRSKHLI